MKKTVVRYSSTGALLGGDNLQYRYWLERAWDLGKRVAFVMLNPSKADATQSDPTMNVCVELARRWGYDAIELVNLYAYRATDPDDLIAASKRGEDIEGPDNDRYLLTTASRCDLVIAAWGALDSRPPWFRQREHEVKKLLASVDVHALHLTKGGYPQHPLYMKRSTTPIPYRPRSAA